MRGEADRIHQARVLTNAAHLDLVSVLSTLTLLDAPSPLVDQVLRAKLKGGCREKLITAITACQAGLAALEARR